MSRVEPNRNVYVGHRYVPKIFGEWDKQNEYEGLSIVTHQGASYTSKKRVPVGIDIKNDEFWVVTGNYNAQVEYYRDETERVSEKLDSKSDQTYVDTELGKKANKNYVDTELGKKVSKDDLVINVKDHGVVGDGVTDDTEALQYLMDNHEHLYIPLGKYKLSSSILIRDGKNTQLTGAFNNGLNRASEEKSEFIVNGFDCFVIPPHDNEVTKVSFSTKNISITGTGTEKGITGAVGGTYEGCNFENLHTGIDTSAGWVCRYERNVFYRCTYGIKSEETYSTSIVENHFSYVVYAADMGENSVALYISRNTVNLSAPSHIMFIVNGSVQFENNYFESFGDNTPDAYFINYSFNRFAFPVLNIENNFFRGNNAVKNAIVLGADRDDGNINFLAGKITNNQITQFTESSIIFSENNHVYGIEINNNGSDNQDMTIDNMEMKPMYTGILKSSVVPVDGELTTVPVQAILYDDSNNLNDDNNFKAPISGVYEITFNATLSNPTANVDDLVNGTVEIYQEGSRIYNDLVSVSSHGFVNEVATPYTNVGSTLITKLNRTNLIELKISGGIRLRTGSITIKLLKNEFTN